MFVLHYNIIFIIYVREKTVEIDSRLSKHASGGSVQGGSVSIGQSVVFSKDPNVVRLEKDRVCAGPCVPFCLAITLSFCLLSPSTVVHFLS